MKGKPSPKSKSGSGPEIIIGKNDPKGQSKAHVARWKNKWEIIWDYYGDDSEEACQAFIIEFRRTFPEASKPYSDDQILIFGHSLDNSAA